MESEILKMALTYGLFAVLFVYLLFYVLKKQEERDKDSATRETKYQEIIFNLTNKFQIIEDSLGYVCKDITEIKDKIFK